MKLGYCGNAKSAISLSNSYSLIRETAWCAVNHSSVIYRNEKLIIENKVDLPTLSNVGRILHKRKEIKFDVVIKSMNIHSG